MNVGIDMRVNCCVLMGRASYFISLTVEDALKAVRELLPYYVLDTEWETQDRRLYTRMIYKDVYDRAHENGKPFYVLYATKSVMEDYEEQCQNQTINPD